MSSTSGMPPSPYSTYTIPTTSIYDPSPLTVTTIDNGTLWNGPISANTDISIQRPNGSTIKVAETLEKIMERLCILEPDFEKMEKYPALKEAYDNYKLIEAMVAGDRDNE